MIAQFCKLFGMLAGTACFKHTLQEVSESLQFKVPTGGTELVCYLTT